MVHIGDDDQSLLRGNVEELRGTYADASVRVAISFEMKQEYEKRYSLPFEVLHNGAADEMFDYQVPAENDTGDFVIRYVGSLLRIQHWNAIEDIVEAVHVLNSEGVRARFEIYCDKWTKKHALALADGKNIVYKGFVAKPELYEVLSSADLLVLPAAFSGTGDYAYRLSMPTKLPEYLASGAPTLVYGPRGMASVELCLRHELAHVYPERSVPRLTEAIRGIAGSRDDARRKAADDRAFAKAQLSATAARVHFRKLINQALNNG